MENDSQPKSHLSPLDKNSSVTLCPSCDFVILKKELPPNMRALCPRCRTFIYDTPYCSINGMLAICIAAIAMFIPANLLPLLEINFLGSIRDTTLTQTALAVIEQGYWFVGISVLITGIIAPGLLLLSILFQILLLKIGLDSPWRKQLYTSLLSYHSITSQLAMLEIFLISLLVSAFQISDFADIQFNIGTFCFAMLFACNLFLLREYNLTTMWEYLDDQGN